MSISIGSKVRSFDFEARDLTGANATYVEGEVVDIRWHIDCDRYVILVDKQIFTGDNVDYHVGELIFTPVNGTPKIMGGVSDHVKLL